MSSNLSIKVHQTKNFTAAQVEKYHKAVSLTEKVINSARFYQEFMKLKFTSNKGMSNQEIYDLMMTGAEVLDPAPDNEVDVLVTMYYKNNKTVGYTYPSTPETWLNSKFFNSYDYSEVGCNLIHEWMHKLGFGHVNAKEHTSVPYAVGYLVERLIVEYIKTGTLGDDKPVEPTPVPDPKPEPVPERKQVCYRSWKTLWLKKICYWVDA